MEVTFLGVKCEQGEIEMGTLSVSPFEGRRDRQRKKTSSRGRMEEMRENPRLAGGVNFVKKCCISVEVLELRVMALTPEAGENTLHQLLGSQVFLSLWEKRKEQETQVRSSIWWGQGKSWLVGEAKLQSVDQYVAM